MKQTLRGRCWAVRPCSPEQKYQLSSIAQKIGKLFAQSWEELWPDSPTVARLCISQCLTLTNKASMY